MTDPNAPLPIEFSAHALRQMFARAISVDEVLEVIRRGEVIEDYPDDTPFPSRLMLAFLNERPLHVVYAESPIDKTGVVVTAYQPDPALWESGFRQRSSR